MQGRLIALNHISDHDRATWHDLAVRAVEPNPLFEPACLVPAARHLEGGTGIRLIVAEEGNRFYGCLPVRSATSWHRLPVKTLTTDVRRMTYLGTPLVDAARGVEAFRALFEVMRRRDAGMAAGLVELKWVHAGGPVDRLLQQALTELGLASYATESFDRPSVDRRPAGNYREHFNSKYRSVLNRRHRQLARDLGGELTVENHAHRPAAIDELIEMEASGYKGRTGVSLTSVLGEVEQFREMAAAFAEQGRLQLLALEADGRAVAAQLSVRGGDGLFALKVCYDESLAKYGPGVLLQLGSIDYFHEHTDAQWIDSCTYEGNDLLLRLYPDRRPIATYLVSLGGAAEAALVKALPTLQALRVRLRSEWSRIATSPAGRALAGSRSDPTE